MITKAIEEDELRTHFNFSILWTRSNHLWVSTKINTKDRIIMHHKSFLQIHPHNKMCNQQETYKRKKNMHAGNALQYIKTKWLTYGKYMTCNEGQKAYLHQPGTEDPSWASHLYNPRPVCKYKLKKLRGQVSNIPSIYIAIPQWIHPRSKKQETAHLVRTEQILHDFLYRTTLKLLWTMSKLNRRYTENQSLSSK